jgi:hypothetical protein
MTDAKKSWLQRYPKRVLGVSLVLMAVIGFLTRVPTIKSVFDWFINANTQLTNTSTGQLITSTPGFFTVSLVLSLLGIIVLVLLIEELSLRRSDPAREDKSQQQEQTIQEQKETIQEQKEKIREHVEILNGVKLATAAIKDRSFPAAELPTHRLLRVRYTYFIHKDWTGEVQRYQEILANGRPIHFYLADIAVSGKAKPVEGISHLSIQASDQTQREVAVLPLELDSNRKSLLLFFLPRIEPTDNNPRKLVLKYVWPQMFNEVKFENQERLSWTLESAFEIPALDFEVFFEPGFEVPLECVIAGPKSEGNIAGAYDEHRRWHGFRYSVKNGCAGRSTYELLVRTRSNPS